MDNNPGRRSSESSEDEAEYVSARECTDDEWSEIEWFDATEELVSSTEEAGHKHEEHEIIGDRKYFAQAVRESEISNSTSNKTGTVTTEVEHARQVLETDIDTGQQKYIQQTDDLTRVHSKREKADDEISITFHALLSNDIDFQTDLDRVILHMFDDSQHNKTLVAETEMHFVCYRQDAKNAAEFTGDVILRTKGRKLGNIRYQYEIRRRGKDRATNSPRDSFLEKVYSNSSQKGRILLCTYLKNIGKQYHQYDGFIYQPVQEGLLRTFKDFFANKNTDAAIVTRTFARNIANTLSRDVPSPENIIHATNMTFSLRLCVEKTYRITSSMVKDEIWESYTNILQNLVSGKDNLTVQKKIAISVLMLNIRAQRPFNADDKANELLCRSFLLKLDKEQREAVEWKYLKKNFGSENRPYLKYLLIELAKNIAASRINGKDPTWMYLLPIIHLLDDTCVPFQEVSPDVNHTATEPKWWGVSAELKPVIESFKRSSGYAWKISLRQIIDKMQYMFDVDFFLPRTILACLSLEELKDALDTRMFPPEVCCACVTYFVLSESQMSNKQKQLEKCVESLLIHIRRVRQEELNERRSWIGTHISADLLNAAISRCKPATILNSVQIFLWFVAKFDIMSDNMSVSGHLHYANVSVETIASGLSKWLSKYEYENVPRLEKILEVWDGFLSSSGLPNTKGVNVWRDTIKRSLENNIYSRIQTYGTQYERRLVEAYSSKMDTYSSTLQDLLSSFVLEILTKSFHAEHLNIYHKSWENISKKFVEECDKIAHVRHGLDLIGILSWEALPQFLKVLYERHINGNLDQACDERVMHVKVSVENCIKHLTDGSIDVEHLTVLLQHKDTFRSLAEVFGNNDTRVELLLSLRNEELRVFRKTQSTLHLLKLCTDSAAVQVDSTTIDAILNSNTDKGPLNELVEVKTVSKENVTGNVDVQINARGLSSQVIDMLSGLEYLKDSVCFMKVWKDFLEECPKKSSISLDDLYSQFFQPALKRLQDTVEKISSGEISFKDMEAFIGQRYAENYKGMLTELKLVCSGLDENILCERINQLKHCRQVILSSRLASVLVNIQRVYRLTGDFTPAVNMKMQADVKSLTLASDKEEILKTIPDVCKFTEKRIQCLEVFLKCEELIKWLREVITDGMKEMKVFVDLAMTSSGDDAEKMSRVQSLHAAVNGFSYLIFEMKQDSGCHEFLKACETVWEKMETTPKLPDKLEYAGRFLHWFKDIKKAHGSVEVTSFMQADVINQHGIYKIGTCVWKRFDQQDCDVDCVERLDVRQVLKLTIIDECGESKERPKEYTFDELHDLQSRLMLVAGETDSSKTTVDRFNSVLEGVVRLCNIYIELVNSGCMLFRDFAIEISCDTSPDRPVVAILEFSSGGSFLKCRKTESEQLEDIMHKIATCLETCYSSWIKHINQNREDYPDLNYFTTDQLVILQKEIARVAKDQSPSKLIFPMLCTIKPNCVPGDVRNVYTNVSQIINSKVYDENKHETADETETDQNREIESKREEFVRELVSEGYENLVSSALKKFPNLDSDNALLWCMEQEDDTKDIEEAQCVGMMENEMSVNQDAVSIESLISKAIDNTSQFDRCETMLKKLEEIWNDFLYSISTRITDCMSLKFLGLLLHQMSREDMRTFRRTLPKGYSETAPNLIVCPNDEMWILTLSLYLSDEKQPLPQPDEVLTCCEQTSLEEVDIFLRRAIFSSKGKLHCLVSPDRMSFTICEEVEQRLIKYLQRIGESANYRLVFICGSESENKSVIISSLDKYRRTMFPMNVEKLRASLAKKLQADDAVSDKFQGAANVDFQRSTVRVIRSTRSGVGKTLYKTRRVEELKDLTKSDNSLSVSLPLHERKINISYVTKHLIPYVEEPYSLNAKIVHFDVTNEVLYGIDYLLFNLLILGRLTDKSGFVWNKLPNDLYLIEATDKDEKTGGKETQILRLLPFVTCRSPMECLDIYDGKRPSDFNENDQLFDPKLFKEELYQLPYACLREIVTETSHTELSERHCIATMLRHCGVSNPSWSEIFHFVKFLKTQMKDFQKTDFVSEAAQEALPGFRLFVQRFLIQMSRDFSSRSLTISEETFSRKQDDQEDDLKVYEMKRTWEKSPHPYLFFNADRQSFTFLGFYINEFGDLVDIQNDVTLERRIMSRHLLTALIDNFVPINEDFDSLHRNDKITRLCRVMGVPEYDESVYDSSYELTTDNCKKMLAIYMRLRCDIPIVVMGETGCGKTRLVKFLCELMVPRDEKTFEPLTTNMVTMKVHGGVTHEEIKAKILSAEKQAIENMDNYDMEMYTILFFDEANTTESIGLVKEIMCDKTMEGKPLQTCKNLKFVAACNPYRRHPEEVIAKLEKAGLGYHVKAKQTKDRFGRIPMRQLVYRVQPLPQSLLPFVWDFGQLDSSVENLYIKHMVRRYMVNGNEEENVRQLPNDEELLEVISSVLTESQEYMRNLKDECSFVSLRDVERVLQVMCWFYYRSQKRRTIFRLADEKLKERGLHQTLNDETRSLILALAVCYHASLTDRDTYWKRVSQFFRDPCKLPGGPKQIRDELERVQEVFLDSVNLDENSNIAKNQALKENVFMMVICIELRIPLFLVGKPGSSKSLAKVVVADAMQGRQTATKVLFKELKQVQMVSFQCSPISTAGGIVSTFRQCASFQENYKDNLDNFVSVVVLDEIGLAEDSDRMPLKTLHPLLEDGCQGDEVPEDFKKVAFIGISNWSLDPAKMNRGIFVQRGVPDSLELENTARGICSTTEEVSHLIIRPLAAAYLEVFQKASMEIREFFGLRDFYSLMKMINHLVKSSTGLRKLTYRKLKFAVKRNFSGIQQIDTFSIFEKQMKSVETSEVRAPGDPDDSFKGLIKSWISDETSENRHLLLLTENYSALPMFQQAFLSGTSVRPIIIFGSSFPRDQEYTQICRNINKIKIRMETGSLVILVNSDNLYESLYDAMNQYYVYFGGERYVDLGLGTQRVKCRVHKDFKLIVVAEKLTVYERFPIPLINRLEKHCLDSSTLLSEDQNDFAQAIRAWVKEVTKDSLSLSEDPTNKDILKVFIGYHDNACSTITLKVWMEDKTYDDQYSEAYNRAKAILIWCTAPDAILRMTTEREETQDIYWNKQAHESLKDYLTFQFKVLDNKRLYAHVTTHSSLLTISHKKSLFEATNIHPKRILLLEALPSFDTEQQFISKIKDHIRQSGNEPSLLVIQCESGDKHANLIACARYAIIDECTKQMTTETVSILFIIQLTPMENTCFHSIQCGDWQTAHIDNLYPPVIEMPTIQDMQQNRMSAIISEAVRIHQLSEDGHEIEPHTTKRLDLRKLIDQSLQRAVSLVKDPEEHRYRSTKRVSMILTVLYEQSSKDVDGFLKGVGILLEKIMSDRETSLQWSSSDNWLATEASSVRAIEKFGTFRRACLQAFDSRIAPILGGIFAVLDTNHNLSILEHKIGSWQRDFWTNLLNTKDIRHILVNDINTDRGIQYEAQGTGYGGIVFQCKMPFSWIIHATFDTVIKRHKLLPDEANQEEPSVTGILHGTELATALESIPKKHFYDVLESYIYDFVQMMYSEEKDRKLVILAVKQSTLRRISLNENTNLTNTLLFVHQVYEEEKLQFDYFRDISSVWPECADALLEKGSKDWLENDLALGGLLLLIDSLSSVDKQVFASESGRKEWLGRVHRCRQVVNQTLAFYRDLEVITLEVGDSEGSTAKVADLEESTAEVADSEESTAEVDDSEESTAKVAVSEETTATVMVSEESTAIVVNSNDSQEHTQKEGYLEESPAKDADLQKSQTKIAEARCKWNRVVMMQLFLEIMFIKSDHQIAVQKLTLLWAMFSKGGVDFTGMDHLKKIEQFLGICFRKVKQEIIRDAKTCTKCGRILTNDGKIFACQHEICGKCVAELQHDRAVHACHKCKKPLEGEAMSIDKQLINSIAVKRVYAYRHRCNAVFLEIVSKLCFSDNTVPSPKVVEWLMSYTFKTEVEEDQELTSLSIEEDIGVDSNSVFKAFLFKHLLRADEHVFRENLTKYVQSQEMDRQTLKQRNDLFLAVIFSLEEYLYDIISVKNVNEWLTTAAVLLGNKTSLVDQIYGTAKARLALSECASYINKMVSSAKEITPQCNVDIEEALTTVKAFCKERVFPRDYLLRYIVHEFGLDVLLTACRSAETSINWIKVTEVIHTTDMYTACGKLYSDVKNIVMDAVVGKQNKSLLTFIQTVEQKNQMAVFLELVVHREIVLYASINRRETDAEAIKLVDEVMRSFDGSLETPSLTTSEHLRKLRLSVTADGNTDREINIKCLLFHWFCVIKHCNADCCELLQPLFRLTLEPSTHKNAYLPAMPQDEIAVIRQQLLQTAAKAFTGQETKYYKCENGHSYEIGECGRPWVKAKCLCGAPIGGKFHILEQQNTVDDGSDHTQIGHCIGLPANRQTGAVPERLLTYTQCAITKWLLHMSMYLGCSKSMEDILSMIKSELASDTVHEFFWDHILIDLQDLQDSLSLSVDEVFLFSHCFIDRIMKTSKTSDSDSFGNEENAAHEQKSDLLSSIHGIEDKDLRFDVVQERNEEENYEYEDKTHGISWQTKNGRKQWEKEFAAKFINPFIEEKSQIIQTAREHLQESSPILSMLASQSDGNADIENTTLLQNNPAMWKFRTPVSVDHFKQAFRRLINSVPSRKQDFAVLGLFLDQVNELQAVRFIPRILQLQKTLLRQYSRKIFQSEAAKLTVGKLKADRFAGDETESLLKDLTEAWNIGRHNLKTHVFRTQRDKMTAIPKQLSDMTITDDTQLVFLLPTMEGKGICTFALLDYLIYCHNRLIETYMSSGGCGGERNTFFTVVSPRNLTPAHVISLQPKIDLLPIILANCSMNSQSSLLDDYDFEAIQSRIIDRFISTRSRIRIEEHLKIDLMIYRSEITDMAAIERLDQKIKQERIETSVKSTLCTDIMDVPKISDALSVLDIAINFLNITGGKPEETLNDYVVKRLKIKETGLTVRMQQTCLLKHVRSLWMTLSFHKSYIMAQQQKSLEVIFENLGSEYYEQLPDNDTHECQMYLERLSKERLLQLLEVLFEYMTLELAKKETFDDEDYLDKGQYRLKDCLEAFADIANMTVDVHDIPENIVCRHSPHVWTCTAQAYHARITEQN